MKYLVIFIITFVSFYTNGSTKSGVENQSKSQCIETFASVKDLTDGKYLDIPVGETVVIVYKRTKEQIGKAKNHIGSEFDRNYPGWWPRKKHPTNQQVEGSKTRSLNDQYFVFWGHGPVYGYSIHYVPMGFQEIEGFPFKVDFLGDDWKGGFVDVVNMIAYDFTGRPIKSRIPEERVEKVGGLPKLNLLVPQHLFDEETNRISLTCINYREEILY